MLSVELMLPAEAMQVIPGYFRVRFYGYSRCGHFLNWEHIDLLRLLVVHRLKSEKNVMTHVEIVIVLAAIVGLVQS